VGLHDFRFQAHLIPELGRLTNRWTHSVRGQFSLPQRLDEVITLTDTRDIFDCEPSLLENLPELRIGIRTMNSMNPPFEKRQILPGRVTRCECAQRGKRAFPTAVNVRQLQNDSIGGALKVTEDLGGAHSEHDRFATEDKLIQLLIGPAQNLLGRVSLNQHTAT